MYPRPGFWYRRTSECALFPVFGAGKTSAKTTLLEATLSTNSRCFSIIGQSETVPVPVQFLKNGSGSFGSLFGF